MGEALLILSPMIMMLIAAASFFILRNTEARKKGNEDGTMKSDITYIKEKVTDISKEQERVNSTLTNHFERIIKNEESTKAAHRRLDELAKK